MSDDRTPDAFRNAFDPVVDAAPPIPRFEDILANVDGHQERPPRRRPLGGLAVGIAGLVILAVAVVIWIGRTSEDDTAVPADSTSTTTTIESLPTYTLADGRIYARSDCQAAVNLLVGGYDAADALPERSQTERSRVEGMLEDVRQRYVDASTGVIEVRAIPRNGEVWYRLDNGGYAVEMAHDYQFEFILTADASCPTAPRSVNGVPVLYNRADDQTLIDSTSTDSLQLDIIDIYPGVAGIDSLFLRNISTEPIDFSGWTISSRGFYKGFTVPDNTVIQPGESIAIYQGTDARGARCREDTARVFFHCNALGQDRVTGDMLFPIPIITVLDSTGALVIESKS